MTVGLQFAKNPTTTFAAFRLCRYEFRYKQSVTTSDNFLGMSGKDPSSTCCEHLVLVVQLPQAKAAAGEAAPQYLPTTVVAQCITVRPPEMLVQLNVQATIESLVAFVSTRQQHR